MNIAANKDCCEEAALGLPFYAPCNKPATKVVDGADNCPLCQQFNLDEYDEVEGPCHGCPVKDATGKSGCQESPYTTMWALASGDREHAIAARAELDFLISLLPEGETP